MGSIVNRRDVMTQDEEIQARIDAGETDLKLVPSATARSLLGITKASSGHRLLPVRRLLPGDYHVS